MVPPLSNFDGNKRYKVKQGKLKVPVTLVRNDGIIYPTGMVFSYEMPEEGTAGPHCPRLPIGSPVPSTSSQPPQPQRNHFSPPTAQLAIRAPPQSSSSQQQVATTSSSSESRFPPTPASDLEVQGNSPPQTVRSPAEMQQQLMRAGPMRGQPMRGVFPPPRHHPYPLPPPPQQMRDAIFQGHMRALQQEQGVFPSSRVGLQLPPIPQVAQDLRMHRGNPENQQ